MAVRTRTRRATTAVSAMSLAVGLGWYSPLPAAAAPRCAGQPATIVGTDDRDHLVGTSGRDVVFAGAGWDRVQGMGGNDVVCGGRGADRLSGEAGDDELYGGRDGLLYGEDWYGDTLDGGVGNDLLNGGMLSRERASDDTATYAGAPRGVTVDVGAGRASGMGGDHLVSIDVVIGTDFADRINGGQGFQVLLGHGGDDVMRGLDGNDYLFGGYGNDTLHGGAGDDGVSGDYADDVLYGGDGDDYIEADFSSPRVPSGDDELYGGDGNDNLYADQYYAADGGDDRLEGGNGRDYLQADQGNPDNNPGGRDVLLGGAADDQLYGGLNTDRGFGGPNGAKGDLCRGLERASGCER